VRVALHTRVNAGAEEARDAAHREVPPELLDVVHDYGAALPVVWRL
jgi:L-rhamnose mutarotase